MLLAKRVTMLGVCVAFAPTTLFDAVDVMPPRDDSNYQGHLPEVRANSRPEAISAIGTGIHGPVRELPQPIGEKVREDHGRISSFTRTLQS